MHVLQTWADISIFIFVLIFSLIAVGALVGVAVAISKLEQQVEKLVNKVDPVILKASTTLDSVQRVTTTVGEKADHILSKGETLTDNVSQHVEKTAIVVEKAVTTPLINLSSLITGVTKGFSVWSHSAHGNGTTGKAKVYAEPQAATKKKE